ncbi:MAG: diguanylate cyclase [Planctomycetota bacterium]
MPTSGHVLLVDDDEDALRLLATLLERNAYSVLTARNAAEAIEVVEAHGETIDVVVLDLMMPGEMNGYDLCDWLRNRDAVTRDIPVIVLSVKCSPQDMARSFASGAFQHITKPYDVHYLLAVVDSMLRLKRIQDDARRTAEKFGAVFENAPVGILVVDEQQEVLEMSRALRERYPDVRPGAGVHAYEFLFDPPREAPDPDGPLTAAIERGEIRRQVREGHDREGAVWWDMAAAPLLDKKHRTCGAVLILQDVTRARLAEEKMREEVEHARQAEEKMRTAVDRYKHMLSRQDELTEGLMNTQRELRQKKAELEESNRALEESKRKLEQVNALLERLSVTDDLTGLQNRRHFNEIFDLETRRAMRYYHPLSVIMLDIDHFKEVNDTYGHPAGDRVLQKLGQILRDHLRETDIIARYGGEEFIMALPETTPEIAHRVAERLRERIENESFGTENGKPLQITVSIGLVSRLGQLDAKDLVASADEALYRAKRAGRNRVVTAA